MSLPPAAFELLAAPAAFVLAALHARRALGSGRAAVELLSLLVYGYALERTAIAVFGSHDYGHAWRFAPGGVPVAVAGAWASVIVAVMALGGRLARSPAGRAGTAALLGVSLDLLMEPVAVCTGLWSWTPPGPWLGVPAGNFVGWGVIVGSYTLGAERGGDAGTLAALALRRLVIGAASVGALLAVGAGWLGLGAERNFAGAGGWAAWGLALAATAAVGLRARPPGPRPERGLATRLGNAGGLLPAAVLLLLAGVFAANALALADPRLALVALGSAAVLAAAAFRAST